MDNVDWDAKVYNVNLSVERPFYSQITFHALISPFTPFKPLSAQVQVVPTSLAELQPRPYLSTLTLEK